MQRLDYELRVDNLVTPQDVASSGTNASTNSDMWRSMTKYRKGLVVVTAYLASGYTASATLQCATAADGTGSETVSGKTVLLTGESGDTNEVGTIEFDVCDLDLANDKYFVGVTIDTNNAGDDVGAVLLRGAARYYKGASMPV